LVVFFLPLLQIIANEHLNRRNRFIIACSMGLGIGVTAYPQWANTALWPCTDCSDGLKSLRDAIILILSSGLT
jgi:xanthine/uracil permease